MAIPDLVGKDVLLVPMRQDDIHVLVAWLNAPGPRALAGGRDVARAEVMRRWPSEFFDDAYPQKGRAFRIERRGEVLGAAIYHPIFGAPRASRLELVPAPGITAEQASDALDALARYVFGEHHVREAWAELPEADELGLAAFRAAGFAARGKTADGARAVLRRAAPPRSKAEA
ncbi:MAG TPA: hypothetical protein VGR28_11525 [Candidatus Thermoplasmatota archaeon]|jgi:hypothetical protein|nr:hypothetical protein [Candidatus Thermoplasmatota archaeon]